MTRRLKISALALLAGPLLVTSPPQVLRAATSSTLDILSDDRASATVDTVDVGSVKPLARPRPEPARAPPSGNPLWSVPLSVLTATQARPIFAASRRPAQAAVVAPVAESPVAPPTSPAEEHPALALIGAVVGDGDAIAVFLDRTNQKVLKLRPGESHGGWKLSGVEGREVTFKKDSRSETLVLHRQEGTGGAPAVIPLPVVAGQNTSYAPFIPRSTPKNGQADGL